MNRNAQSKTISIIAAIMLCITYIACGFLVCAGIPMTTEKLSLMTSNVADSPYDEQQLTYLALEVRDFTVNDYGRSAEDGGVAEAEDTLAGNIVEVAKSASDPDSPTADKWNDAALAALSEANSQTYTETMEKLAQAGDQYALSTEAVSHLNDVNSLVSRLFMPLLGVAILAAFCLMAGLRQYGYICAAKSLLYAGCITLGIFAVLAIWALVSFSSLFACIHAIFFADGTWTFPVHSLLIQMYPADFWMGMGIVWLTTTCIIAALSILFAILMQRSYKRSAASSSQVE